MKVKVLMNNFDGYEYLQNLVYEKIWDSYFSLQ